MSTQKSLKHTVSPQAVTAWQALPRDELKRQMAGIEAFRDAQKTEAADKHFAALSGILPGLVQEGLRALRKECLGAKGYVSKNFNIFSGKDPAAKALQSVEALDEYFRKNGVSYDSETHKLTAGEKPRTSWESIKDWRFFWAAAGGIALGTAGIDLQQNPAMAESVNLFFNYGLQWGAPLFIGLNVFKAFTEHNLLKALPTMARFSAITAAGFGVGYLVNVGLSQVIPMVDPSKLTEFMPGTFDSSFSPMLYLPYIIGGFAGAGFLYKGAKQRLSDSFNPANLLKKAAVSTGNWGLKAADSINAAFPSFITYVGIPAILTLLSHTIAEGGVQQLKEYAGFYATAGTGLVIGTALMLGAYWALGCRTKKDFKEIMKVYKDAVSISSSSMVLDKEIACAQKLGVSKETTERVIPLAGVFNMYGLSLYLGQTAFYALNMFGHDPGAMEYAAAAATIFYISMGAPGVPAATVAFLGPVMQQMGFSPTEIHKTFAMILPGDRFADMGITGANALGDMVAAVWEDRDKIAEKHAADKQAATQNLTATSPAPEEI